MLHRLMTVVLMLGLAACAPRPSAEIKPPQPAPAKPELLTLLRCNTNSSYYQAILEASPQRFPSYATDLQFLLQTEAPLTELPAQALRIESFTDDLGTDLLPAHSQAGGWPSAPGGSGSHRLSPDGHRTSIFVYSKRPPAPGSRWLKLRGTLTIPYGEELTTASQVKVALTPGTKVVAGPMTFTLKLARREGTRYYYRWESEGPLNLVRSIELRDAQGKEIPSIWTPEFHGGNPLLNMYLTTAPDSPTFAVTYFASVRNVEVPLDLTMSMAGIQPPAVEATLTKNAEHPTTTSSQEIRLAQIWVERRVSQPYWNKMPPLTKPAATQPPPWDLYVMFSAILSPADGIASAKFLPQDVVVDSITDDTGTDLSPGYQIETRLAFGGPPKTANGKSLLPFTVRLARLPDPAATTVTIRGHATVRLVKQIKSVDFPVAGLQDGQELHAGTETVKVYKVQRDGVALRLSFLEDSLSGIESLDLFDAAGNPVELEKSKWTESQNLPWKIVYLAWNPARPVTLRVSYASESTTRKIPFVLQAAMGN